MIELKKINIDLDYVVIKLYCLVGASYQTIYQITQTAKGCKIIVLVLNLSNFG